MITDPGIATFAAYDRVQRPVHCRCDDLTPPAVSRELHREHQRLVDRWLDDHDFDFVTDIEAREAMLRKANVFADRAVIPGQMYLTERYEIEPPAVAPTRECIRRLLKCSIESRENRRSDIGGFCARGVRSD